MTLKQLYEQARDSKPEPQQTPAMKFITRCMNAAKVKENTVRLWISGTRRPDALAQEALAVEFGIPAEQLFPQKKCVSDEK